MAIFSATVSISFFLAPVWLNSGEFVVYFAKLNSAYIQCVYSFLSGRFIRHALARKEYKLQLHANFQLREANTYVLVHTRRYHGRTWMGTAYA